MRSLLFFLGSGVHKTLYAPSKSRVSVSPSPMEFLQSHPVSQSCGIPAITPCWSSKPDSLGAPPPFPNPAFPKPFFPSYYVPCNFGIFHIKFLHTVRDGILVTLFKKPLITFKIPPSLLCFSQMKRWSFKYQVLSFIES